MYYQFSLVPRPPLAVFFSFLAVEKRRVFFDGCKKNYHRVLASGWVRGCIDYTCISPGAHECGKDGLLTSLTHLCQHQWEETYGGLIQWCV